MLAQQPQRFSRGPTDAEPVALVKLGEEVLDEEGDVLPSSPERRHLEHRV